MTSKRLLLCAIVLVAAVCAMTVAIVLQPAFAPIATPSHADFDAASRERGARVVALGDCMVCHTAKGGMPFAGGLALRTPFGTLYTTNITPQTGNGIGDWSLAAFTRALRHGVSRDGHLLYPAFPYIHYTRMSDQDIGDAYAYLMTRTPVDAPAPPNDLIFPLTFRPMLAGWNLLYLRPGPRIQDAHQSVAWNRGRYLVDSLGHCASCHSSLNPIGGEGSPAFGGGNIDGWVTPALTSLAQAPTPWNAEQLTLYLRNGWSAEHGAAAGPMQPVTHSLAGVPEKDVAAMATYIMSLQRPLGTLAPKPRAPSAPIMLAAADTARLNQGAVLFSGACAGCHTPSAPLMAAGGRASLALSSAVVGNSPDNLIQTVLYGLPWQHPQPASFMPAFQHTLTDAQVASIAAYVRVEIGRQPLWNNIDRRVAKIRKEYQP